jgi:hypothetical protein
LGPFGNFKFICDIYKSTSPDPISEQLAYHDRAALGKYLDNNITADYIMRCHSFIQNVETADSFDSADRRRGHHEEVGRNVKSADFIWVATGSNFDCDTGLS